MTVRTRRRATSSHVRYKGMPAMMLPPKFAWLRADQEPKTS